MLKNFKEVYSPGSGCGGNPRSALRWRRKALALFPSSPSAWLPSEHQTCTGQWTGQTKVLISIRFEYVAAVYSIFGINCMKHLILTLRHNWQEHIPGERWTQKIRRPLTRHRQPDVMFWIIHNFVYNPIHIAVSFGIF